MTIVMFEIAKDIPYSDIELMINDIQEKYTPLLTKGKLVINGNMPAKGCANTKA